jgi:hypothetical protein
MSTMISETAMSVQERSSEATGRLCEILGLGHVPTTKLKFLTVALAEAAVDEASNNDVFANKIRSAFESMVPAPAPKRQPKVAAGSTRTKHKPTKLPLMEDLEPIGTVDESLLNPYAPPNPWALRTLYGDHQLRRALGGYSLTKLKQTAKTVQSKHPGTKPHNASDQTSLVDYIVEQVTSES